MAGTTALTAPLILALVCGLIAVAFGTIVGALAVRTEGIYTIMITLAIGVQAMARRRATTRWQSS